MKILAAFLTLTAALLGLSATAHADPVSGCFLEPSQYAWYNPCSGQAPWNQSNWVGADNIPGTYGPHGYTPRDDARPSS